MTRSNLIAIALLSIAAVAFAASVMALVQDVKVRRG